MRFTHSGPGSILGFSVSKIIALEFIHDVGIIFIGCALVIEWTAQKRFINGSNPSYYTVSGKQIFIKCPNF